jgi:hypothetical protein
MLKSRFNFVPSQVDVVLFITPHLVITIFYDNRTVYVAYLNA